MGRIIKAHLNLSAEQEVVGPNAEEKSLISPAVPILTSP